MFPTVKFSISKPAVETSHQKARSNPRARAHSRSASSCLGYTSKSSPSANCVGFTYMLTTTASHCFRAILTRLRWPSCKHPIVGTKPTVLPCTRCSRDHARMDWDVLKASILLIDLFRWNLYGLRKRFRPAIVYGGSSARARTPSSGCRAKHRTQERHLDVLGRWMVPWDQSWVHRAPDTACMLNAPSLYVRPRPRQRLAELCGTSDQLVRVCRLWLLPQLSQPSRHHHIAPTAASINSICRLLLTPSHTCTA